MKFMKHPDTKALPVPIPSLSLINFAHYNSTMMWTPKSAPLLIGSSRSPSGCWLRQSPQAWSSSTGGMIKSV